MEDDKTTEFSFILKPSKHGVGVFAAHDIRQGVHLRLFGDNEDEKIYSESILRDEKDIPEAFNEYTIVRPEGKLLSPRDFGHMYIGWYINHSRMPNAAHKDLRWYSARDIKAGEEVLVDYNSLMEPQDRREDYYNK